MSLDLGPLGKQSPLAAALLGVGALTVASIVYHTLRVILSIFLIPGLSLSKFGPKGSWAVVTGASDGIGKQFALQLARKGFNILLVSRTQSKLDALSQEITASNPNVTTATVAIDFSKATDSDYAALARAVEDKQVAILVNNVGQSHSIPVSFSETTTQELSNIININCLATLRATQTVLPAIVPNKKGLILTMGSFGGLTPTPYLATYSGSKAFLQQWSTALASELAPKGITVHFIHSYLVTSAMSKIKRANFQVPSEKNFVKAALAKIGRRGGSIGYSYSGSPYWSHAVIAAFITGVLGPLNGFLLEFNRKMHVDIRNRALRKAEREKAKGKKES
ncbi:hypothetical protein DV735_g4495, partial [Chaetothyriales sp. CBS 134920]